MFSLALPDLIEYIPLQQGLRQQGLRQFLSERLLIEYIPLQQGLRHSSSERVASNKSLIEYIPLQQGLRLKFTNS